MFDFLPETLRTILAFVVVLGVLIFFHELGHYLAARWRRVHVDVFSIGFGRAVARWTDRRGTEWRLAWIPLGGYVKLHGHLPSEELPPEARVAERPGETFHDKPVRDRALIVVAGPVANFVLAALLFAGLYATVGAPRDMTTLVAVNPDSPAAMAGMQPGDAIVALDGQRMFRFDQVQRHIQPRAGQEVQVTIRRDGRDMELRVTPIPRPGSEAAPVGILGVQGGQGRLERLDPLSALGAGIVHTYDMSAATLSAVWEMLTGQRSARDMGGPIRIAEVSGEAATLGIVPLLTLMALLSISLALLNLFPIPLLDGGHLVFYAIEAIRGRPLPPRAQEYGFRIGFALLISLFLFVTFNDIVHGSIGRWFSGLFG